MNTTDYVMCGSNVHMFSTINNSSNKQYMQLTNHLEIITWANYKQTKSHWVMNHPSLCYRKSAVLEVGNYNTEMGSMSEDFELELRILKKYEKVYNIQEPLLYYRIHSDQATYNGKSSTVECVNRRNQIINMILC